MKKLTIKNLIKFKNKNDKTKSTFVNNLNKEKKESKNDTGGDYWISALSAIRNSFKKDDQEILDEKVKDLNEKIEGSSIDRIKNQYQRNIDIIHFYQDFDSDPLKPKTNVKFLKQIKDQSIMQLHKLPVEAKPCFIFSFSENDSDEIGGVWFVAQLRGFNKAELGMFAEVLFKYLDKYYSKDFFVNPSYCTAIDLFNGQSINFKEIQDGVIPSLLDSTLDDFSKF